jgi:hypothetical protein
MCEMVDWIHLAQDKLQLQVAVKTVKKLLILYQPRIYVSD